MSLSFPMGAVVLGMLVSYAPSLATKVANSELTKPLRHKASLIAK